MGCCCSSAGSTPPGGPTQVAFGGPGDGGAGGGAGPGVPDFKPSHKHSGTRDAVAGASGGAPSASGAKASHAEVIKFIDWAAAQYHADPKVLENIAKYESNFATGHDPNTTDINAQRGTPSDGMFQFIEPTFNGYAPDAQKANPQAFKAAGIQGHGQWMDWRAQALTTAWAITHGHEQAWATYHKATEAAHGW